MNIERKISLSSSKIQNNSDLTLKISKMRNLKKFKTKFQGKNLSKFVCRTQICLNIQ